MFPAISNTATMVFQEEKFTPEIFHPKGANLTSSTLTSSWNVSSAAHHESNVSAMVVPEGCLVLQFSDYLPWDNPKSYISLHTELISYRIKVGLLMPICFFFGAPANIINMMAFYRQGLKERINLCLFSQSLVDFLYLVNCMARYGERLPTQLFEDDRSVSFRCSLSLSVSLSLIHSLSQRFHIK